jgi:hypothetical protein
VNKLVRLLGVAFISIAILTAVLLGISVVNYDNVTETRVTLPDNIYISEIRIPKIDEESVDVTMNVFFNVTNPSKIAVYITSIESYVYMNDLSDPRPFQEKRDDLLVGVAQFTLPKEQSYVVKPGKSLTIPVNLTVSGGTRYVSILNTTSDGKYYPIIEGSIRYTYDNVDIIEVIRGVTYFGPPVEPYE